MILPPHQPVSGWVAVSQLARTRDPGDYAWLDAYRPLERVGKTIDCTTSPEIAGRERALRDLRAAQPSAAASSRPPRAGA